MQSWTITVSNIGSASTTGPITVSDTVPTGLALVGAAGAGWTCQAVAPAWTCNRSDSLAPTGVFPPITISVNVLPSAASSVTNIVTVSGGGDLTPGNNTATDITTIGPGADLVISKAHTGVFRQGGVGTYQLVVSNKGLAPTVGVVTVDDPLAPSLTLAAPPVGPGWTCNPAGPLHCQRSDVLINGASYPPITLTVNISQTAPAALTNTVTGAGGGDINSLNNTDTDTVNIESGADLTVTKTHAANFVQGQTGMFTIVVSNVGMAPSSGEVRVLDLLPGGLIPVSATGSGWTCTISSSVICSRADSLAPGGAYPPISLSVEIGLTRGAPRLVVGVVHNPAEVRGGNDYNLLNNLADDAVSVLPAPDLTINKTHAPTFGVNGVGTYTITVRNLSETPSIGPILVSDSLPNVLTVTSASGSGWTCGTQPQTASCSRSDALGPLASYPPISITVRVSADAKGIVYNRALVAGGGDIQLDNNTAIDPATIIPGPDLTMSKSHTGEFLPGSSGVFTLSVTNGGGQPTSSPVTVTDTIPTGLVPISVTGTGWTCGITGQSVSCLRSEALPAGASYPTISISVNIPQNATGSLTNTATTTGGGECPSCGNNNTGQDTVTFGSTTNGSPLSCAVNSVPPIVRREGITELVGDIILTCRGGTPTPVGTLVQKTNLQVFLNTNLTSRINAVSGFSEALLMIDDPWPAAGTQVPSSAQPPSGVGTQRLCATGQDILGTGTGAGTYDGLLATSCNMFLARPTSLPNSVVFAGIPIDPPGAGTRVIRITNVRANASQLGDPSSLIPAQVVAFISASPQSSLPLSTAQTAVAFVSPGLIVSAGDVVNLAQCVSMNPDIGNTPGTSKFSISVTEGFATAFNRRTYALGSDPNFSPDPSPQNIPGMVYHSETGFFNPAVTAASGLADFGSRVTIRFDSIGAGVSLFVPTVIPLKSGPGAADLSGSLRLVTSAGGPFSAAISNATLDGSPAASLTVTNGTASAVYEVLNSNSSSVDFASIPVGVSYVANTASKLPAIGTTTASGSFAPVSTVVTADGSSPIPRFIAGPSGTPLFMIYSCTCSLLFPFVTNQVGFDTGIAISNTSKDPFGTPAQAGTVTINYYGRTSSGAPAPVAQISQVVNAGQTLTFNISSGGSFGIGGTPDFQGYIIAQADFQYCHGFAFISDLGSKVLAEGYLALVMDQDAATRTGKESESLQQ